MKNILLPALLILSLFSACKKDDHEVARPSSISEYFRFGREGGFAGVHQFFVIKDGLLYPGDTTMTPLSMTQYNIAKALINDFPQYLADHPNQSYTCQQCADQFTMIITRRVEGVEQTWVIDDYISSLPPEIRAYAVEIRQVIDQL